VFAVSGLHEVPLLPSGCRPALHSPTLTDPLPCPAPCSATEAGMPLEAYAGYLDLRKYGSVPHSGELVWLGGGLRLLKWLLSRATCARGMACCVAG